MPVLDLNQIRRDAITKMEIADKAVELQTLVTKVYPGHRVLIISPDDVVNGLNRRNGPFESLNGTEQIINVLMESSSASMELSEIHAAITRRGGTMSPETLMSLLSRGKDVVFSNPARGIWALRLSGIRRTDVSSMKAVGKGGAT